MFYVVFRRRMNLCSRFIQVLDWVTGPGLDQATKSWDIGESVTSAELCRKEHDSLEKATKVQCLVCF